MASRDLGSDWVGICLDTVNSLGAAEGIGVVVETLGPSVVNLHLKDFVVLRAAHMMGFSIEGRPAGRGQLDVPGSSRALPGTGASLTRSWNSGHRLSQSLT